MAFMSSYMDEHISMCTLMCEMNIKDMCACLHVSFFAYVHVCTYMYTCVEVYMFMYVLCGCLNACTYKYMRTASFGIYS